VRHGIRTRFLGKVRPLVLIPDGTLKGPCLAMAWFVSLRQRCPRGRRRRVGAFGDHWPMFLFRIPTRFAGPRSSIVTRIDVHVGVRSRELAHQHDLHTFCVGGAQQFTVVPSRGAGRADLPSRLVFHGSAAVAGAIFRAQRAQHDGKACFPPATSDTQ